MILIVTSKSKNIELEQGLGQGLEFDSGVLRPLLGNKVENRWGSLSLSLHSKNTLSMQVRGVSLRYLALNPKRELPPLLYDIIVYYSS